MKQCRIPKVCSNGSFNYMSKVCNLKYMNYISAFEINVASFFNAGNKREYFK